MPTTTNESVKHLPHGADVVTLSETVTKQAREINRLQNRVSTLTDEVMLLGMELKKFRVAAAADINQLFERANNTNE